AERDRLVRARRTARRQRRRALLRRLTPRLPDRRTGRLYRRSRGERAAIAVLSLAALATIWLLVDDAALRLALIVLLVLGLPAIVVIVLGRRT
ncbi:MAG TPA: hypothetical protein VGD43_00295, partial [Micromonospora sp.]